MPLGKDTLRSKLNTMCKQAGISGNKTNHSLRATSATQMYNSGVPEKIIQERTGHRSLEALRMYERINQRQHQAVSSVLSTPVQSTSYNHYIESERVKVSHTTSEAPQTTQYATVNYSFQNLHGCTINISHIPPPQPQQNTKSATVSDTEVDVDKLIASINNRLLRST